MTAGYKLKGLFCKPANTNQILYTTEVAHGKLSFLSLQLATDLDTIFTWVNSQYAKTFWQMNGSVQALKATYKAVLENPHAHAFMVLLNGQPVGQVDLYQVGADELKGHIESVNDNDCGLHLLMLPPKESKKNLALRVLQSFIEWYFAHPAAGDLYAEPDMENATANLLAVKAGFNFVKEIQLSSKTANLYCIKPTTVN